MIPTASTAVQKLLEPNFSKCESPSLRLEKFVVLADKDAKKDEIGKICACANNHARIPAFRYSCCSGSRSAIMKLQSRLIINQAGGVLENAGLCLHPHFGCPMIPGSAVKGIARAAAIQAIRNADSEKAKTDLLIKTALAFGWGDQDWSEKKTKAGTFVSDFRYACGDSWESNWGTAADRLLDILKVLEKRIDRNKPLWESMPNFAGLVSFMPALPTEKASLVVDLVNCHHPEYYQGKRQNADDTENPVPNFFPAVEAGACFEFVVAPTGRKFQGGHDGLLDTVMAWLKDGLSIRGAGAKTNAGYGWFEHDEAAQRKAEETALKAASVQEKARQEAERVGKLSPEEFAVEEFWKSLGNDPVGALKGKMPQISTLPETDQRSICRLLAGKYAKEWKADVAEAAKAKGPDDKKGGKSFKRVNAVRPIAEKLGVKLP